MPQAATAANIASALTHCQMAAGPKTRNGAARRATTSAPSSRRVTITARAVEAASSVTTMPAWSPLPSPIRSSTTKKPSAPGGWPATWTGQFALAMSSGSPSYGIRATQPARIPWKSVVARAVRRYSYSVSRIFPMPSRPSTRARLTIHASPPAYDASSSPRHGSRCASGTDHPIASAPTSRAGRVPGPSRGSQSACSGGKWRTCTSQSARAGSAIATDASTTPKARPANGAMRWARVMSPKGRDRAGADRACGREDGKRQGLLRTLSP